MQTTATADTQNCTAQTHPQNISFSFHTENQAVQVIFFQISMLTLML